MAKPSKKEIWVVGDLRTERFLGYSLNALAKARDLARDLAGTVSAVLMGASAETESGLPPEITSGVPIEYAREKCLEHGAGRVYLLEDRRLSEPRADVYAQVLSGFVKKRHPVLVLMALTEFGRELAARTAMMEKAGLIAGCVDLQVKEGRITASCPSWGGEIIAEIVFAEGLKTGFATIEPHAFHGEPAAEKTGTVERIPVGCVKIPKGLKLVSRSVEPEEHRKLEEAQVVVVGGAGVGSAENFALVRHLAASLGGEVAATRPPVLNHWVADDRLIGQTGKTVRPNLLFSIATSGAIQYTAGIMEAGTIVAVNRDPGSPIFQIADYGVVADARSFLPVLISRVNQAVMRSLADGFFEKEGGRGESGFGAKVRKLRQSKDWSLEKLSQAVGQSPEFIQQVENDEVSPSVSFLLRLASTLKVDPGTFLRKEEQTFIRDMRAQALTKRTQNYSYRTLTAGAETDHLHGFMIVIESRQTHKPVAYKHEGEEFVFVLEGDLELTVGDNVHNLKSGESLHFHSDTPHKLKNLSHETTRCLVVLYTP